MESWREAVLAADAKKAGSASEASLFIPSLPSLIYYYYYTFAVLGSYNYFNQQLNRPYIVKLLNS